MKIAREIREQISQCIELLMNSHAKTDAQVAQAFAEDFALWQGGILHLDEEVKNHLENTSKKISKAIGPRYGNSKLIQDTLIRTVQNCIDAGHTVSEANVCFIKFLENLQTEIPHVILPNNLVILHDIECFSIGPVQISYPQYLFSFYNTNPYFSFDVSSKIFTFGLYQIHLGAHIWSVETKASIANSDEEALWLIDIAISILRLLCFDAKISNIPNVGYIESDPVSHRHMQSSSIKILKNVPHIGGPALPGKYILDKNAVKKLENLELYGKTKILFAQLPKSLAERAAQALGWLTRGRRSIDRSERILYFFTAIEAVLSSDDKTAPVLQNIARRSACILTNNYLERPGYYKKIKKLYEIRSKLIHQGLRSALQDDANEMEFLAHKVVFKIVCEENLNKAHGLFIADLEEATFGESWPK